MSIKLNKIVFVEDDAFTNAYLKIIAEREGIARETLFFSTDGQALSYFSAIPYKYEFPELIFINNNLPGMSGHEFIDAVRDLPAFDEGRTQLVYLTDTFTNTDVAAFAANGMKHFYFKAAKDFDLRSIVNDIFGYKPEKDMEGIWP